MAGGAVGGVGAAVGMAVSGGGEVSDSSWLDGGDGVGGGGGGVSASAICVAVTGGLTDAGVGAASDWVGVGNSDSGGGLAGAQARSASISATNGVSRANGVSVA